MNDKPGANQGFPKHLRLRCSVEFRRVFAAQQSVADQTLVVYGYRHNRPHSRLGLAVSRKVGNAVIRNRWKRYLREAFRQQQERLPPGLDLVVLPRRGATASFRPIQRSLPKLVRRLAKRMHEREQA